MKLPIIFAASVQRLRDNDGPGIPEAHRSDIFERFVRVHEKDADGSGLGQAIVSEVAANHGRVQQDRKMRTEPTTSGDVSTDCHNGVCRPI